jgi:hypothetical protein
LYIPPMIDKIDYDLKSWKSSSAAKVQM